MNLHSEFLLTRPLREAANVGSQRWAWRLKRWGAACPPGSCLSPEVRRVRVVGMNQGTSVQGPEGRLGPSLWRPGPPKTLGLFGVRWEPLLGKQKGRNNQRFVL